MKRDLSALDRDIGQDWSRIIQEAFKHGIDCNIIQGGLLEGKSEQGIYEVSDTQNYGIGDRLITPDGRIFHYAKSGGICYTGQGSAFYPDKVFASKCVGALIGSATQIKFGGKTFDKDALKGGYITIFGNPLYNAEALPDNASCPHRLITGNNACVGQVITGASEADPCVITIVGHGYATGDIVTIADVGGMVELNDRQYTITVIDEDTFSLDAVDSEGYTTYTSGGVCTKGDLTLDLDGAVGMIVNDKQFCEVYYNIYSDLRLGTGTTQSFAGLAAAYISGSGKYFWVQTWGPVWVAPQVASFNSGEYRDAYFRHDVSIQAYSSDQSDPYALNKQRAGFIIPPGLTAGPLLMLQISP